MMTYIEQLTLRSHSIHCISTETAGLFMEELAAEFVTGNGMKVFLLV